MSAEAVDVVLFTIGPTRYGADLAQVLRIDLDERDGAVGGVLGRPAVARRSLVFPGQGGATARLLVDEVLGITRVPVDQLRRFSPATAAPPLAAGAWLDGDTPVVLVDLTRLL